MLIKNTSQLFSAVISENQLKLRKIGINALEEALHAVTPKYLIENSLKIKDNTLFIQNDSFNINDFKKVLIIGAGKASAEMALELEKILINIKNIEYDGIINIHDKLESKINNYNSKIKFNPASHPIPNREGVKGSKQMMEIIRQSSKNDLIICLISGGGSALLPLPKNGLSLEDLQRINSLLLASGASVHEINTIRKHISGVKGGNLAKEIFKSSGATLISLIISDVVGDNLDSIASGPTVPDLTTYGDAIEIIKRYHLYNEIPPSVLELLEKGLKDKNMENPKPNEECFNNVYNYLIGSVNNAVQVLIDYLSEFSFKVEHFSNKIIGEARKFGKELFQIISQKIEKDLNSKNKIALIGTGELTVTIKGNGIGGRNQEMLLSFTDSINKKQIDNPFLIIGANLDGLEGNSDAMGAIVDNFTLKQISQKGLNTKEFLNNNDSNSFFKSLNSEIITGPTGCNVNDLLLILISNKEINKNLKDFSLN